jgi:hypothetical protein
MFECIPPQTFERFTIFLHIILEYNLGKRLKKKHFISSYKMEDWSIFVETNVMYMCISKTQIYSKKFLMDY